MLKTRSTFWYEDGPGEAVAIESQRSSKRLLAAFWIAVYVVAAYLIYLAADLDEPLLRMLGAAPVFVTAVYPSYLWCAQRVHGVPIFPVFALTYLWTYAIPLVSQYPVIIAYSGVAILTAGLTVAGFLILATFTWRFSATLPAPWVHEEKVLREGGGRIFFFAVIMSASLLTMATTGQWFELEAGIFSILRAVLNALAIVGLFALSYKWGEGELSPTQRGVFVGSLVLYLLTQLSTLYLVGAIVATSLVIIGFTTGRHHFPWVWVLIATIVFGFLHLGKGPMRDQYWQQDQYWGSYQPIQIWDYPGFFAEWFGHALGEMHATGGDAAPQPIYERVSLAHLLLKVQDETPNRVPYLYGATYAIVPQLLIPRILDPEKLTANEGTAILNIHYGIQSREDTATTTIGWGLLNEAYANFGLLGVAGLALMLGAMYGWVTRRTAGAPVLALRSLVAMTFAAAAVQAEFSAGVYFSALFQSLVSVYAASFFLMSRQPVEPLRPKGM